MNSHEKEKLQVELERLLAGKQVMDAETVKLLLAVRVRSGLDEGGWRALGSVTYEKVLLRYLDDAHVSEKERKFLDDLARSFQLEREEVLLIRQNHAREALQRMVDLAFEDERLSVEEKAALYQLGDFMGLSAEFVETFLASKTNIK